MERYVDGSSNRQGSGVGVVLISPQEEEIRLSIRLSFRASASNNEAEYEAVLAGLQAAKRMGAARVQLHSDSQLVAQQVEGGYGIHNDRLRRYAEAFAKIKAEFMEVTLLKIPRTENGKADELARLASSITEWHQEGPITQVSFIAQIDQALTPAELDDWISHLLNFLQTGATPSDPDLAKVLRRRATRFTLVGDQLYRRAFSRPLLKRLGPEDVDYVLREAHQGCYGNHPGGRSLARKILLAMYFWSTLQADAAKLVSTYLHCQKYQSFSRRPTEMLKASTTSCPFDQWGMDIWVEAEALARITEEAVIKFLWKNIICRYDIPQRLVFDNGRQFQGKKIQTWCQGLGIQQAFTSVAYPQANGQAEVTNREILRGLKTKLDHEGGSWVEELPCVLWAYRTTPRESTGMTPFHLVYGGEVVVPMEVEVPSDRRRLYEKP
ncbi:uncharacterized protein LOC141812469 [Curcuma longa]|uniref:uncharacterized protein LOC141812469 n=1 Tax=Curcuma longa TaxID=136217 RepID=UPI003D9DEB6D